MCEVWRRSVVKWKSLSTNNNKNNNNNVRNAWTLVSGSNNPLSPVVSEIFSVKNGQRHAVTHARRVHRCTKRHRAVHTPGEGWGILSPCAIRAESRNVLLCDHVARLEPILPVSKIMLLVFSESGVDTGRVDPRVGSGRVGPGRVRILGKFGGSGRVEIS